MHIDNSSTNSRALLALAVASFGIGTTEFVIMGLLPDVAHDLRVPIPQAGLLVSGYALGVVLGAPILAVATARLDRRRAGRVQLRQGDGLRRRHPRLGQHLRRLHRHAAHAADVQEEIGKVRTQQ